MSISPFHLALPIINIEESRQFYIDILGCTTGRSAERWLDVNFWGHQLSLHVDDSNQEDIATNSVDEDDVPVRHFGVILEWKEWHNLKETLEEGEYATEIQWVIAPKIRFAGEVGEQATMFIKDPSNVLDSNPFNTRNRYFCVN